MAPGRRSQGPASSLRRRRRGAHGHGVGRGPRVLTGAALLAGVSCSATAACVAAWLAEDLRAAAVDASTPGWAALKRLLGPPDGEVVLRDGRIVKRGVVVADV